VSMAADYLRKYFPPSQGQTCNFFVERFFFLQSIKQLDKSCAIIQLLVFIDIGRFTRDGPSQVVYLTLRERPLRYLRLLERMVHSYDFLRMWLLQFLIDRPNLSVDHSGLPTIANDGRLVINRR